MTTDDLHWTEIDGVTTIWTDAPPPLHAALLFRTGRADETLATAGYTHLIEHLALSALGDTSQRHNGFVGGTVTGFFTMGLPQDVAGFFATVCDALTSLPGDHLENQKQVLAAEIAAQPFNIGANLLMWRYGAAGYGLLGLPQLGHRQATLEQLQVYGSPRFTKENAVLWLSGPPPADLDLRLPSGAKQPIPPLAPIRKTLPGWFFDDRFGGVTVGATVPRVSAATIFCEIASRRLRKHLRTAQAVSYAPAVVYDPLNADTAHLVLSADSDREHRVELTGAFGEVFRKLNEVEESEVEAARRQIRDHMIGALAPPPAMRMAAEVQRAAMDWIFGREHESLDSLAAGLLPVTVDDVREFGRAMQATALFSLPGQRKVPRRFGRNLSISRGPAVQGRVALSVDAPINPERLVHGPDGVSVKGSDGFHWTVRYSELEGALFFEDGGLCLFGSDATGLWVEPTIWRGGQKVVRTIRERVPAHLVLDRPTRPPDAIPKPRTTAWQRFRARLKRR